MQDCGNGWTSMKGRVTFWFHLNLSTNEGFVQFKLYGQVCKKCCSGKFEYVMWYPEEVSKVNISNILFVSKVHELPFELVSYRFFLYRSFRWISVHKVRLRSNGMSRIKINEYRTALAYMQYTVNLFNILNMYSVAKRYIYIYIPTMFK